MTDQLFASLDRLTRVPHVRGAVLVGRDDGLIVADNMAESANAKAMAALVESLASRLDRMCTSLGSASPRFIHLSTERGVILAMPINEMLLLLVSATRDANVGLVRHEMLQTAASA